MQNRQNNINYNQYYTPSMNKYSYNKNKETFPNPPNNNIRSFSSNQTRIDNKQINSRNYTYLNKQDNPLKNSNKQNIPNPRSPQPYSNLSYKENISAPSNSKNYFSPNPNQIPEKINLNGFKSESKNYPISMNYNSKKNKKTLILDLDETLVHSGFHPFNRKSDFTLNIKVDGKNHTIYVLKRPYVEEFLSQIAPYFEIIIFTASISEYASPLIDMLDKNKLTSGRLFRQHCLFNHGLYLKDIKIIKKDLKDTIIIDNNPVSYVMNQDNGLPILTWYDDLNDKELLNLIPLLKYLSTQNDVRDVIKNIVDRQNNKIKFDIVDELIKKKINGNNIKREIIYQTNDNYNKNNINKNISTKDIRKKDDFNTNTAYKQNYINNYDPNKYEIKENDKVEKNRNYNNINKEEENKIKNYFNDDKNFYLYNNYNNSIHDSLSNMTYNEIQNEGTINNEKEYQNDYDNDSKTNNTRNNIYKESQNYVIQQAINYDNYKHYEEKNKINNLNKQNELLNKGNNERRDIRAYSNSNYEYKINNANNNFKVSRIEQKPIKKNYSSSTYNPKYDDNQESKYLKNDFYLQKENYNNNNYYEDRYTNNINNNNDLRKNKLYERIKDNNYISENNKYLENLTIENNEKDENLRDNYLKLYQQELLKSRTNEKNYPNNNLSNNNNNNIHIYQNKNNNSPYIQNLNTPTHNLNRNHSINSLNYRRNNMNLNKFNNNNNHNINMNNNNNNFYNQRFMNNNQQNDLLKREQKNILVNDEIDNIPDANRQRLTTNLRFFKTQNNFTQSYKDKNKNIFNINNNYNQNNNFRFNNNFRRNNEEKNEKIIQPKINNYFNNNNENELNRSFSGKKIFPNNRISNIDLDRKARERKKYNFTPYYVNRQEQNQINVRNINLNNNMNPADYMNQRNDTDIFNDKKNEEFVLNNDNNQNNNTDYRNKIFEYKRESNYYNNNFNEKINNFKKEYQNQNNNENNQKYSEKLSKTEERKFYRSSSSNPNIYSNNYNYLYNNENSRIPRNYNSININNYNFYNSFIGNNPNNQENERNDENRFYNNKYRMQYYVNRDDDQTNELNRSSSYFHPKTNYYSMLNNKNESFTPNDLKRNNVLKTKFINNLGNY